VNLITSHPAGIWSYFGAAQLDHSAAHHQRVTATTAQTEASQGKEEQNGRLDLPGRPGV
jgi:hypothetical protein